MPLSGCGSDPSFPETEVLDFLEPVIEFDDTPIAFAMTITKEIASEQMSGLDLHQGDSLRVVAELGATLLIQIVKAVPVPSGAKRGRAGEWGRKYAGAAKGTESVHDLRMAHYQEKYGI